jgi:hypothetical protein
LTHPKEPAHRQHAVTAIDVVLEPDDTTAAKQLNEIPIHS